MDFWKMKAKEEAPKGKTSRFSRSTCYIFKLFVVCLVYTVIASAIEIVWLVGAILLVGLFIPLAVIPLGLLTFFLAGNDLKKMGGDNALEGRVFHLIVVGTLLVTAFISAAEYTQVMGRENKLKNFPLTPLAPNRELDVVLVKGFRGPHWRKNVLQ